MRQLCMVCMLVVLFASGCAQISQSSLGQKTWDLTEKAACAVCQLPESDRTPVNRDIMERFNLNPREAGTCQHLMEVRKVCTVEDDSVWNLWGLL